MQIRIAVPIRRALYLIATVAILAFLAVAVTMPQKAPIGFGWLVLPAMALIAEFLPVQLASWGIRITFTLPFVAGIAVAVGPVAAIATDVLVTLVAGYALVQRRKYGISPIWLGINASVSAVSAAFGTLAMASTSRFFEQFPGWAAASALTFMCVYALANFLLVTYFDCLTSDRRWSENVLGSLKLTSTSLAFYALVGITVAVLVHRQMYVYVPLTLVPVWALRTGLLYQAQMYDHYYGTITTLTLMLQRSHPYTHGHIERVARTAEEVARRLGLPGHRARMVREAAVLHDIGKIAVDERILDKPAKLTEEEMDHVRMHARWGGEILAPVKQFQDMIPWILHHHERPDGNGYPSRLSNALIPLESKIIAVVDAYDAMTGSEVQGQSRAYRETMTVDQALAELDRCKGTQFDPEVVRAFKNVVTGGRA